MPETRFTQFSELSVDPETDVWLFFLLMSLKLLFIIRISLIFDILRRITTFSERHSTIFVVEH